MTPPGVQNRQWGPVAAAEASANAKSIQNEEHAPSYSRLPGCLSFAFCFAGIRKVAITSCSPLVTPGIQLEQKTKRFIGQHKGHCCTWQEKRARASMETSQLNSSSGLREHFCYSCSFSLFSQRISLLERRERERERERERARERESERASERAREENK